MSVSWKRKGLLPQWPKAGSHISGWHRPEKKHEAAECGLEHLLQDALLPGAIVSYGVTLSAEKDVCVEGRPSAVIFSSEELSQDEA